MVAKEWITPFKKQCFVTSGVSINIALAGLVMGFTAGLLPQLQRPDSEIPIDDSTGSWIAAVVGVSLVLGNLIVPTIMARYGRKVANISSLTFMIVGWICIVLAKNVVMLLVARLLQGISMGMSPSVGPVLIGEYSSPKNRGVFLMTITVATAVAVLSVHTMVSYLSWRTAAMICTIISFVDLLITLYSPESPSWLADKGRYDECKKVFRWLRGDKEDDELNKMIDASIIVRKTKAEGNVPKSFSKKVRLGINFFCDTIKKKEFYKPIIIMMHVYTISQWAGINILVINTVEVFERVVGADINMGLMILFLDLQRIISNTLAMYVVKKVKRRTMLFAAISISLFAFLAMAVYTYAREQKMLPFDHPFIGVFLIHVLMFSAATGTLPLCFTIAGEIFPLEYRSLAGGISITFLSMSLFILVKTAPFLFKSLGIYGAFCLYAGVVTYSAAVTFMLLPETKDRTLQDIEDEFRGRPLSPEELKSVQSLTSMKYHSQDRRCSGPYI